MMDSNLLSGHNWEMRRPVVPPAIPPKPVKKPEAKALLPTGGSQIPRKYFSSSGSIPNARPQSSSVTRSARPLPVSKPQEKPSLNPFDFKGGQILRGVANTRNTRYQLDKQLRGIFNKSSTRSKVVKAFTDKISASGKLSLRDAKQASYQLRKEGFSQSEINRVRRHMGF